MRMSMILLAALLLVMPATASLEAPETPIELGLAQLPCPLVDVALNGSVNPHPDCIDDWVYFVLDQIY